MTVSEARELLRRADQTHTGRQAIRDAGYECIIGRALMGDDDSTLIVAAAVQREIQAHLARCAS